MACSFEAQQRAVGQDRRGTAVGIPGLAGALSLAAADPSGMQAAAAAAGQIQQQAQPALQMEAAGRRQDVRLVCNQLPLASSIW